MNKLETSLIDDARVVSYDHHMYIEKATGDFIQVYERIPMP